MLHKIDSKMLVLHPQRNLFYCSCTKIYMHAMAFFPLTDLRVHLTQPVVQGLLNVFCPVHEGEGDVLAARNDRDQPSIGAVGHKRIQWDHLQEARECKKEGAYSELEGLGSEEHPRKIPPTVRAGGLLSACISTTSHHMEIVLRDAAVFEVQDPLQRAVVEQVHLLQVGAPQWH